MFINGVEFDACSHVSYYWIYILLMRSEEIQSYRCESKAWQKQYKAGKTGKEEEYKFRSDCLGRYI